jgi:hypothetical protein
VAKQPSQRQELHTWGSSYVSLAALHCAFDLTPACIAEAQQLATHDSGNCPRPVIQVTAATVANDNPYTPGKSVMAGAPRMLVKATTVRHVIYM